MERAGFAAGEVDLVVVGSVALRDGVPILEVEGASPDLTLVADAETVSALTEVGGQRVRITGAFDATGSSLGVESWELAEGEETLR